MRESVKPLQAIDSIKILQVDGLHSARGGQAGDASNRDANFSDQLVSSALKYRAQAPVVDSLLNELGLSGKEITNFKDAILEPEACE